jgi:hypothetical protein
MNAPQRAATALAGLSDCHRADRLAHAVGLWGRGDIQQL